MDNWYVLSVITGRENICVKDIEAYNVYKAINDISPFIPTKETFFKKQGNIKIETSIMFPSYVFIETPMEADAFLNYAKEMRRICCNFMTVLKYGDSGEIAVMWEERLALMQLMNYEWCVKASHGFKEDNVVRITEGSMAGKEARIKKIDRYKMKAWVEVEMFGKTGLFEVGLQVLKV